MKKVFIDGSAGTTGLRIRERLEKREDVELITLPEELRKEVSARKEALNAADVAFLCLPDAAAVESASLVENPNTVVIDTSTAHRVDEIWTYGFAELAGMRSKISVAKRIANPGCHASGFIALVAPLVENGIVDRTAQLCAFSLTGYSGGGKKMIADYERTLKEDGVEYLGGRQYALGQTHKHLPEMKKYCSLDNSPVFSPIVVPHLSGMEVTVQLHDVSLAAIKDCYREYYKNAKLVKFDEKLDKDGFVSSAELSGRDDLLVGAYGNDERVVLVSLFDNLGKGASGAALQNMNIALGVDETEGLIIG